MLFLDNPFLLFSPWASALFSVRAKISTDRPIIRYGFATLVGAMAVSAAVMSRPLDLSRTLSFWIFSNMYLSGVILLFLLMTVASTFFYLVFYEVLEKSGQNAGKMRLAKFLMFVSLLVGHVGLWLVLIVPQNL